MTITSYCSFIGSPRQLFRHGPRWHAAFHVKHVRTLLPRNSMSLTNTELGEDYIQQVFSINETRNLSKQMRGLPKIFPSQFDAAPRVPETSLQLLDSLMQQVDLPGPDRGRFTGIVYGIIEECGD